MVLQYQQKVSSAKKHKEYYRESSCLLRHERVSNYGALLRRGRDINPEKG